MKNILILMMLCAAVLAGCRLPCMTQDQTEEERIQQKMTNPLNFPVYTRTVKVKFSSKEEAEKVQAKIAPLAYGKRVAVTSRWDDSNPRNLVQSKILAKNGWRGVFLLNGLQPDFVKVMREAVNLGMSVGNHGTDHPYLTIWNLNALFREITIHQAEIEAALDYPSVSFTVPCNVGGPLALCPDRRKELGELLSRAGIYSHPEGFSPNDTFYRPEDCAFGAHMFSANDRDPDPAMFRKGFEAMMKEALKDPDCPRVTFGVHTWQSDDGFKKLDKLYAEFGNRPECWYCNENEFAAYRYQFCHAQVTKTAVNGCEAEFTIVSFEPAELGASVPLRLEFTGAKAEPVDVSDAAGHTVPEKIGMAAPGKECAKFKGLSCAVEEKNGKVSVQLRDRFGKALDNVRFVLIPPPAYEKNLYAAGSAEADFKLGKRAKDPQFDEDPEYFLLRADFVRDGHAGRLFIFWKKPYERKLSAVPRDTVLVMGPFPEGKITDAQIAACGSVKKALDPLGATPDLMWRQPRISGMMPYAFCPVGCVTEKEYKPFVRKPVTPKEYNAYYQYCAPVWGANGEFLFAVDFDNGKGGSVQIASGKEMKSFWLDGKPVARAGEVTTVQAGPGKHRLLILAGTCNAWAYRCNAYWFGLYREIPGAPLKCMEPEFRP